LQVKEKVTPTYVVSGWIGFQRQCWGLKLGASRESTNVMVVLRLIGLGDTGGW